MSRQWKDEDGKPVKAGDIIVFSYGIPPVSVVGPIFERGGKLWVSSAGHKPHEATLGQIVKHCGGFTLVKSAPATPE